MEQSVHGIKTGLGRHLNATRRGWDAGIVPTESATKVVKSAAALRECVGQEESNVILGKLLDRVGLDEELHPKSFAHFA